MFNRTFLYDFGVSQDDPNSEMKALRPARGDRILCIASAGEVPLELLVNSPESVEIDAVDIAEPQLFLTNLKLQAAKKMDTREAARFLGFLPADEEERKELFERLRKSLSEKETNFWVTNPEIFAKGPINLGRYETYMARFAPLGRWLLGGHQKMLGLFETGDIKQQKEYFDNELRTGLLKNLFKLMFHPRLYRSGGISEQGLIHMEEQSIGLRFYSRFRDFCTNTPVHKNWMLQLMLFNRVLFNEALPNYLQPKGSKRLQEEEARLRLLHISYTDAIKLGDLGYYNKFALSNVSDWLPEDDFMELMDIISVKAGSNTRGLIRYIHSSGIIPSELADNISLHNSEGEELLEQDRFPFYNLIPFRVQ